MANFGLLVCYHPFLADVPLTAGSNPSLRYMGALTNNGRKLANFAGFYKGIQSVGAVIIYRVDALEAPFMNLFVSCWALLAGSLLVAAPVIVMKIRETVTTEEDLKFSDETLADVTATNPGVMSEEKH